jgi:hypothetical protein
MNYTESGLFRGPKGKFIITPCLRYKLQFNLYQKGIHLMVSFQEMNEGKLSPQLCPIPVFKIIAVALGARFV